MTKIFIYFLIVTILILKNTASAMPIMDNIDDKSLTSSTTQYNNKTSSLSIKDGHLVDQYNRTVILHGLNVMNKQIPYTLSTIGFDSRNIKFIKQYGFNVIRLGIFWDAIEPISGTYDVGYLNDIKATVISLSNAGIYTLVDFHQDNYGKKTAGSGFPDWATIIPGNDYLRAVGYPLSTYGFQNVPASMPTDWNWDKFWNNQITTNRLGLQDSYADMISYVINYFKNTKSIIGYDLMNEPFPGSSWTSCKQGFMDFTIGCKNFDEVDLTIFYNQLIAKINDIDKTKILFYEPNALSAMGAPILIKKINGTNLGICFHNYYDDDPMLIFKQLYDQLQVNRVLPFMGEFGAAVTSLPQLQTIADIADQYQISWTEWAYFNNPPYKISGNSGSDGRDQGIVYDMRLPLLPNNVQFDRLHALSRPYPQMIAGDSIDYRYQARDKSFYLHFRVTNDHGKPITSNPISVVYVPDFQYHVDYIVHITGAIATKSSQDPQILYIHNSGAKYVNLQLTPR